jgi:hypothetical protein
MRHNLLGPDGTREGTIDRTDGGPPPGAIVWNGKTYIRDPASTAYRQAAVLKVSDEQVTRPTAHKANPITNPAAVAKQDKTEDPNG